jgi:hypothetical protein
MSTSTATRHATQPIGRSIEDFACTWCEAPAGSECVTDRGTPNFETHQTRYAAARNYSACRQWVVSLVNDAPGAGLFAGDELLIERLENSRRDHLGYVVLCRVTDGYDPIHLVKLGEAEFLRTPAADDLWAGRFDPDGVWS